MSITVQEANRFFSLKTAHTEYQMAADQLGVLRHLWYGGVTDANMGYLLAYPDVGFSGNPYDAGGNRTYSLDTLPLEYAGEGTGDFRIKALELSRPDGATAVDLRYDSYAVKPGKYDIPGQPCSYGEGAETLEITLKDKVLGLKAVLRYGVFEELDIITRSAVLINEGTETLSLEKAASLCLDVSRGSWEWVHFHGRHTLERQVERAPLLHGIQESSSRRGTSSHHQNPTVLLCEPDCTEIAGNCMGAMLVYSGSFQTQIELDQLDQVRMVMGIHPDLFRWVLEPGERFYTPEAVLCYSGEGFQTLSHRYHRFIRAHICRGKYQFSRRPVLINNWEATYFDFDEACICAIARNAASLGVEMLVLDDGWFGKRNDDVSGLGDWTVNTEKLPDGLSGLAETLRSMGMKLGIWFEPEAVSEDSDLYRSHPDWVLKIPGRSPVRGRYQLVLDLSRKEVEDYLFDAVSRILCEAEISYVKWDMNRSLCDWFSVSLPPERMGELPHRYVLGLYSLLERLTAAFPDVLFEGCSGGGGRFDAGMLYYCPQIWCSDDTDAYERTKIQYGTSFFYPISTMGSHVSAVPNLQTGRVTPLEARAVTAMAGSFGYELDLSLLSADERDLVREQIRFYQDHQALIYNGTYYRLSNPQRDAYAAWEFVSEDRSQALIQGVVFRRAPNWLRLVWKPRGLDPERLYRVSQVGPTPAAKTPGPAPRRLDEGGQTLTGAALMSGGILLPEVWGDFSPIMLKLVSVSA